MNAVLTGLMQMVTGKDNKTIDVARVGLALSFICFNIYSGYTVWVTQAFDMEAYGIGCGSLLGFGSAAVKVKETTEPDVPIVVSDKD